MPETQSAGRAISSTEDDTAMGSGRSIFFDRVFAVVSRIPPGRVTTYGAIARALGAPRAARSVGWALSAAPAAGQLPCHRVVDRNGFLSGGWHWGHPDVMAGLLDDEGVPFLEPHRVDLAACLWVPDPGPELGGQESGVTSDSRPPSPDSSSTARSWRD